MKKKTDPPRTVRIRLDTATAPCFALDEVKMCCVSRSKYKDVQLALVTSFNLPFAEIEMDRTGGSGDKAFTDGVALGEEIVKRWNAGGGSTDEDDVSVKLALIVEAIRDADDQGLEIEDLSEDIEAILKA